MTYQRRESTSNKYIGVKYHIQVLGNVPPQIRQQLDSGRSGSDIASELLQSYVAAGVRGVYLVPPNLRGGARDYDAAQQVFESV